MVEKRIPHKLRKTRLFSCAIWRDGDYVHLRSDDSSISWGDNRTFYETVFHAGNIPAVIQTVKEVFALEIGDLSDRSFRQIDSYNDDIVVKINLERGINWLAVSNTHDGKYGSLHFEFEFDGVARDPEKRRFTPAMVWVTKQLLKEHKVWNEDCKINCKGIPNFA
ncbi:hypothetical protein AGMMS49579_16670 [Spirochaetia bacterium]|nr:hypothetical protein AGMMS49579_16670 [Spirochaetia bacterium]